jgi:hypothetical protein
MRQSEGPKETKEGEKWEPEACSSFASFVFLCGHSFCRVVVESVGTNG